MRRTAFDLNERQVGRARFTAFLSSIDVLYRRAELLSKVVYGLIKRRCTGVDDGGLFQATPDRRLCRMSYSPLSLDLSYALGPKATAPG